MQLNEFLKRLHASLEERSFLKLTLGNPVQIDSSLGEPSDAGSLKRMILRPVEIRGELCCAVVSRFARRDQTANLPFEKALDLVEAKLGREFRSGHLFTQTEELQLQLGQGDRKDRLRSLPAQHGPALLNHDRAKARHVDPLAPYLAALGVTDSLGKIRMRDKFRQIERFVDLLDSAFREVRAGLAVRAGLEDNGSAGASPSLAACDMGSGKGYLTFAAYDYFQRIANVNASMTGVENRPELVRLCNRVAGECGFGGLTFAQSTIDQFPVPRLDVLIALHACDTATDDAIAAGVRAGASLILVAPCCQKEIRPQVDKAIAESPLRDVLRHGIFAERHAEMATDALRALLLERAGYKVRVCEFVAPEHTAKNVMLIATRSPQAEVVPEKVREREAGVDRRISELKSFYGIQHHRLQQLLLEGCQLGDPAQAADPVS
jgi:hypothetical protein